MRDSDVALILRAPRMSDGAKSTLIEMILHFNRDGMPSYSELAKLRGVQRSTIQTHLEELIECGVLSKVKTGYMKVKFDVNWKQIAKMNGLKHREDANDEWIISRDAVEAAKSDPVATETILTPVKNWHSRDFIQYFNFLRTKKNLKKEDANQVRNVVGFCSKTFGLKMTKLMIEYLFDNCNKMNLKFDSETLRLKADKLFGRVAK